MTKLKKLLNIRLTDKTFKIIFFIITFISVIPMVFFYSKIITLENKWFEIAKNKEVIILDESGNVWNKKLYSDNEKIATLFGISFIKHTLSYNHTNFNDILKFIDTLSSNKKVSTHYKKLVHRSLKQLKIINGYYQVNIQNYKIKRVGNKFVGIYKIKHNLVSSTTKNSSSYLLKMDVILGAPTSRNSSGFFIESFKLIKWDAETHNGIFSEQLKRKK